MIIFYILIWIFLFAVNTTVLQPRAYADLVDNKYDKITESCNQNAEKLNKEKDEDYIRLLAENKSFLDSAHEKFKKFKWNVNKYKSGDEVKYKAQYMNRSEKFTEKNKIYTTTKENLNLIIFEFYIYLELYDKFTKLIPNKRIRVRFLNKINENLLKENDKDFYRKFSFSVKEMHEKSRIYLDHLTKISDKIDICFKRTRKTIQRVLDRLKTTVEPNGVKNNVINREETQIFQRKNALPFRIKKMKSDIKNDDSQQEADVNFEIKTKEECLALNNEFKKKILEKKNLHLKNQRGEKDMFKYLSADNYCKNKDDVIRLLTREILIYLDYLKRYKAEILKNINGA